MTSSEAKTWTGALRWRDIVTFTFIFFSQVEERRRDIEKSEQERREAILARNKERESRLESQRRNSRGNIEFAFGSSAPRLVEPRVDSASGYWGSRR